MEQEISLKLIEQNLDFAFTKVVETYQERVYWHIRRLVYLHDDANDVTQNTFIKVYKNLPKFKGESKLYSWIYRVATNEAINFLKQKARRKSLSFEDISIQAAESLTSDPYFNGDEVELMLQKAVAKLPEKQRIVFQMKYFEALKYEEISVILNSSVGSLKSSYYHATKKIEAYILIEN